MQLNNLLFIKAQKKAIYDQFGEEGLKSGVPIDKNNWSEAYSFCGDPHKIFHEFFGGDNPFTGFLHYFRVKFNNNINIIN